MLHIASYVCLVQDIPRAGQQIEAEAQEDITGDVQHPKMRVACLSEQRRPQVAGVMGQQIEFGELGLEPARHQVDGEREAVHLHEQRDDERRKGTEIGRAHV